MRFVMIQERGSMGNVIRITEEHEFTGYEFSKNEDPTYVFSCWERMYICKFVGETSS